MHPKTPPWLQKQLTLSLSLVPLRDKGVRQTIEFIAASYPALPPAADREGSGRLSQGPLLPVEAIVQATKLLSSVPSSMTAESFITKLAPQLHALLDGQDGPEMSKAAGHIVSGILGRKALGAPDKIGWKTFGLPILRSIMPTSDPGQMTGSFERGPVTSEPELYRALSRLSTIIFSHPNPGLTKRLVRPIVLPLWGILSYAISRPLRKEWKEISFKLLESYLKFAADIDQLDLLAANLVWDGPPQWKFGPGAEGGIELRRRSSTTENAFDALQQMTHIDTQVGNFMDLVVSASATDEDIGQLFLRTTRRWLLPDLEQQPERSILSGSAEADPLDVIVRAKLVQAMLERFKEKFVSNPAQLLELNKQLLEEYVNVKGEGRRNASRSQSVISIALGEITTGKYTQGAIQRKRGLPSAAMDSEDLVSISLGLLSTIMSAPDLNRTPQVAALVQSILPLLAHISDMGASGSAIASEAQNLISLMNGPDTQERNNDSDAGKRNNHVQQSQAVYAEVLQNLRSESPPIRAEALTILQTLIASHSPAVSLPATTLLLIQNVLTDPESFVYLAGIKTLITLAEQDPRLVARLIADAFADPNENGGLELRLRVGEALASVVDAAEQRLLRGTGKSDTVTLRAAMGHVAEAGLAIAGRRGKRPKTQQARMQKAKLEKRKNREAERAWGGDVPRLLQEREGPEESDAERRQREILERVLHGWEETGIGEDVRLRTSALSILGQLAHSMLGHLDSGFAATVAELSIQILRMEGGPEKAILRRAAAMALVAIVRAADVAVEASTGLSPALQRVNWEEMEDSLKLVSDVEEDELAKGHARTALEDLEAIKMKRLLGFTNEQPRLEITGRLAGLEVDPEADLRHHGGSKIEEME